MKPLYRPKEDVEKTFLYRKWGSTDGEKMDRTHLFILDIIKHRWEALSDEQRGYFSEKQAWEERWARKKETHQEYQGYKS